MENGISGEMLGKYEKECLKIDKDRVLTYSQLSCPFECTYCFVNDMTTNRRKEVAYLTEKQAELLENLPDEIKLIMLGCDTEFFQNKQEAVDILRRLSKIRKDISVITKIPIGGSLLEEISEINGEIRSRGNILSVSISLPCISREMIEKYEPKVPTPERRLETVKRISREGIPIMLAIRPLLPDISEEELQEIVNLTKDYVDGYYSGPLYLNDDRISKLLPNQLVEEEAKQPHWMLDGNLFREVTREGQMEDLKKLVKNSGKKFFEGVTDGVEFIRSSQNEKHRTKS